MLAFEAPRERELPSSLVAEAQGASASRSTSTRRGCWSTRLGPRPLRLRNELERLALWAGEGGEVGAEELEAMIADTSEEAIWSLADAIIEGDEAETLRVAERLVAQGEALPRIIYSLAPRLRQALRRLARARGGPAAEGGRDGPLDASLRGQACWSRRVRRPLAGGPATAAIRAVLADLRSGSRGGSDYARRAWP